MNDRELLAAIGDVTVRAASLEWLRAQVIELLDPGCRSVEELLGLTRDRTTKTMKRVSSGYELAAEVEAFADDSEGILVERDSIIHAVWPIEDLSGIRWQWHRGSRQLANIDDVRELAFRIGGVTARGVGVLNRINFIDLR